MGPHIKWKLKETLWALFAFYYGELKWLHNSGLKWAQHGMKIDSNFWLTSCWFMTRLVCNFPDSATGSRQIPTACWAASAARRDTTWRPSVRTKTFAPDKRSLVVHKSCLVAFVTTPRPPSNWKRRAEKAEFLVLGKLNCSQKPFVNLLCLSGIN